MSSANKSHANGINLLISCNRCGSSQGEVSLDSRDAMAEKPIFVVCRLDDERPRVAVWDGNYMKFLVHSIASPHQLGSARIFYFARGSITFLRSVTSGNEIAQSEILPAGPSFYIERERAERRRAEELNARERVERVKMTQKLIILDVNGVPRGQTM